MNDDTGQDGQNGRQLHYKQLINPRERVIGEVASIPSEVSTEPRLEPPHDGSRPTETEADGELRPVLRNERGWFQAGTRPGPGRWPAGRRDSLKVLDTLLADADNLDKLKAGLQERLDKDPAQFWLRFIVPLLPKELTIGGGDGVTVAAAVLSVRQALGMPNNGGNGGGGGV